MAAKSDALENLWIDAYFRGQTFTFPTTLYFGLLTANATDSTAGTEVSGGSYARVGVACSLANFAGTQGAGTTTASTGTSGTTSNNTTITFPAPTASWGVVVGFGLYLASTGGSPVIYAALTASKTINNGDAAPSFAAGAFTYQDDN